MMLEGAITYRFGNQIAKLANEVKNTLKNFLKKKNDSGVESDSKELSLVGSSIRIPIGASIKDKIELHELSGRHFDIQIFEKCVEIIKSEWSRASATSVKPNFSFAILGRSHESQYFGKLIVFRNKVIRELKESGVDIPSALIQSSTVHSYKGAQSDCVIILDAFNGVYPGFSDTLEIREKLFGDSKKTDYIDSINLFYVAVTRAKQSLHIFTDKNPKNASPFLRFWNSSKEKLSESSAPESKVELKNESALTQIGANG